MPLEPLILELHRQGDSLQTILGVLDREHQVKVAVATLRTFIRSRLESEEESPDDPGDQPTLTELLAPLHEEIAGLRDDLTRVTGIQPQLTELADRIEKALTAIESAGEGLDQAALHIREQRSASVYDYLRGKLRGVWIRALVITFVLWGVISAAVWYVIR